MKPGQGEVSSPGKVGDPVVHDLLIAAARPADSIALRGVNGAAVTYSELEADSRQLAQRLISRGVVVGDRVAFQVRKSMKAISLHLALLRCGAIQVPINPDYAETEVHGFLSDADAAVFIRDPACAKLDGPWADFTLNENGHGTLLDLSLSDAPLPAVQSHDGAAILFTSGTTGRPKGALLTHRNLAHNALTLIDAWGFTPEDHLAHVLPLFHTHGLFVAVHCALGSGASMTVVPRFDVDTVLDVIAGETPCTVLMGVPTHYSRLLNSPRFNRTSTGSVRLLVSGSAPMTPRLHEEVASRTGHEVLERYGMTETSMLTSNPLHGRRKPGSVGRPLAGVDVRIAGTDTAREGAGEVEVRGPNVFSGYWRQPELHDQVFTADGWFRTGDLGRFDSDGYLFLVGRVKDLIISGGLNVYPADVESVLDSLPGVRESAVVGVPDADLGERVMGVVVLKPGADADGDRLRLLSRERLAGYQVPKRIVIVDELPRNAMGKVEKSLLREALVEQP
ncbi:MAG: AMP-binding protein [Actinomycetes bacterium]